MDESGFTESERKGLLGKVINYLDNANMNLYSNDGLIGYSTADYRSQLLTYFTNKELKMILIKIKECEPSSYVDYINIFRNTLTDHNINKIWYYLNSWRSAYWNGNNMNNFLCGFLGNLRRHRESTIDLTSRTLHERNQIPLELIRKTSSYLDDGDKASFSRITGGSKSRKYKLHKKRKSKSKLKTNSKRKHRKV